MGKLVFPPLAYSPDVPPLVNQAVPAAMVTVIRERGGYDLGLFARYGLAALEENIAEEAARYAALPNGVFLKDVFHKVQLWGGEHGRYVYVQGTPFSWPDIAPAYGALVEACLREGRPFEALAEDARMFHKAMRGQGRRLGLSFITKHVRFWTGAVRGADAAPIFDAVMAWGLGIAHSWRNLPEYWRGMAREAALQGISINALERQLFDFFRTTNVLFLL